MLFGRTLPLPSGRNSDEKINNTSVQEIWFGLCSHVFNCSSYTASNDMIINE
jgi:hypothetical protein